MHSWPVRVYYEDTDAGGVVFYANYLKFFERGRTEWLRTLGFESQELLDRANRVLVVRKVDIEYLAPARLDDELSIVTQVSRLGGSSIQFDQVAWRGQQPLAQGQITVVCVDTQSFKPARLDAAMRQAFNDNIKDTK